MNEYNVKRLALTFAVQAQIEGMKVENTVREFRQSYPAYDKSDFDHKASLLESIAAYTDDQLDSIRL